jgi:putative peptidoglycan lipid II flippase
MLLFKRVFTVSFFTLISRVLGFVRDIMIAHHFGTGPVADAFFAAFKLPNVFRRMFAEGAMQSAFIPIYAGLLAKEGEDNAAAFSRRVLFYLSLTLFVVTVLVTGFAREVTLLLAPGFDQKPEVWAMATTYTQIMMPYLIFMAWLSIFTGILNTQGYFRYGAIAPIFLNAAFVVALVLFPNRPDALIMAWAVTISGVVQLLYALWGMQRHGHGLWGRPAGKSCQDSLRRFLRLFWPAALGAGVYQINILVDMMFASTLPSGAISYLYYADRFHQLPLGIIAVALSTALLPMFSSLLKADRYDEAVTLQHEGFRLGFALMIPAAAALVGLADLIMRGTLEHGTFSATDALATARALQMYALALPAYAVIKIMSSACFARENTKTPVYVALVGIVLNVVLCFVFIGPLNHAGIALATALSTWVQAFAFMQVGQRLYRLPVWGFGMRYLMAPVAASALMLGVLYGLRQGLPELEMAHPGSMLLLCTAVGGGVYGVSYSILCPDVVRSVKKRLQERKERKAGLLKS